MLQLRPKERQKGRKKERSVPGWEDDKALGTDGEAGGQQGECI